MAKRDMLKLFGLDEIPTGKPTPGAESVVTATDAAGAGKAGPVPAHAVDVDLWGVRRGQEFLNGEYAESLEKLNLGDTPDARNAAGADLFAAAFEPEPELNESCTDAVRHEFLSRMVESPEYRSLHTQTMLDETCSELAATEFARQLSSLRAVRKDAKPPKKKPGQSDADAKADAELERDIEAIEAAGKAVAEATKEVEIAKDAAAACGMGGDGGIKGLSLAPKAVNSLYQRVKNDPNLRRICELAGRYRRLAQGKQKNRVSHGYDDMVGVTLGGDVGKLVSSELAMLGIEGLDDELAIRIVESRAVVREHQSVEPVGKGPIVVTVDESGSMSGEKVHTAKALALAMAWVARSQRRWCCLVGFSGGTEGTFCVLPPGRWDEGALCDWLVHFFSGGTDLDIPVAVLPKKWDTLVKAGMTRGATDIIMITDAIVHLPKHLEESFLAFKKTEKVKLTALVVQSKPGDLVRIADDVHQVGSLGVTESAVEKVVSI